MQMSIEQLRNQEMLDEEFRVNNYFGEEHKYYIYEVKACNKIYGTALEVEKSGDKRLALTLLQMYFSEKKRIINNFEGIISGIEFFNKSLKESGVNFIK